MSDSPSSSSSTRRSSSSITRTSTSQSASASGAITTGTFTTPSPPSSIPTETGRRGNGGGGMGKDQDAGLETSAKLYLYTFLATLILLLFFTAAIVLRSVLLRRRHQRMIEEAIRNGTWVPPESGRGSSRRRFDPGDKPKMFEVYLGGPPSSHSRSPSPTDGAAYTSEKGTSPSAMWDDIRPFSVIDTSHNPDAAKESTPSTADQPSGDILARVWRMISVRPSSSTNENTGNGPGPDEPPLTVLHEAAASIPSRQASNAQLRQQPSSRQPSAAQSATALPVASSSSQPKTSASSVLGPLTISVLIAMPSPIPLSSVLATSAEPNLSEEPELPYLEVGVVQGVEVHPQHQHLEAGAEKGKVSVSTEGI